MKYRMKLHLHFQALAVVLLTYEKGLVISPHILLGMWFRIHARIKYIVCQYVSIRGLRD